MHCKEQLHFSLLSMLDSIGQAIAETLLELFVWFVLWPVVLIVSTPFIFVHAAILALTHKQRFRVAVVGGYSAVSDRWKHWAI